MGHESADSLRKAARKLFWEAKELEKREAAQSALSTRKAVYEEVLKACEVIEEQIQQLLFALTIENDPVDNDRPCLWRQLRWAMERALKDMDGKKLSRSFTREELIFLAGFWRGLTKTCLRMHYLADPTTKVWDSDTGAFVANDQDGSFEEYSEWPGQWPGQRHGT